MQPRSNASRHPSISATLIAKGLDEASFPEERLRRFIRNLFRLLFPEDPEYARRSELIWLGLGNASPAITVPIERFIRPIKDILESIIQEILGQADAETVQLCIESIVGQQFFHAQNKFFITQLYTGKKYLPRDVGRLAEHIYSFSIAGLKAVLSIIGK
ncbi:CerR family C-terminal domain-containing protein [Solidesulfovibrio sp. C21]|uniref:CerR family C-terminal domain-containing protein n=1 Tax=Solidesulfovibrio sp. C21 TaxID=3398613 RepID=UPI0039FD6830